MILLLDNFDSFTYNLVDYFHQLGVTCKVFRNSESVKTISSYQFKGVVLSPGPGVPSKAGCLMEVIEHFHLTHPVLGICLGHQALGEFFGAKLGKAIVPMHGKISKIACRQSPIFKDLNNTLQVVRYHSLIIKELPDCLTEIAINEDGEIMAMQHKILPVTGLQFHPEAVLTESGLKMLDNWIKFNHLLD